MQKVLVTFLPAKNSDDKPYMDIIEFLALPANGDFIRFGNSESQTFQIVQVVHHQAKHDKNNTFCVTVIPTQLPHAAILKSEESRDNQPTD
jgi:hypothetical protein